MKKSKAICRITAMFLCTILIFVCIFPVFTVKADGEEETPSYSGIFSQSWFEGWDDIYNLAPGFGDMAPGATSPENISGTDEEKNMISDVRNIMEMVHSAPTTWGYSYNTLELALANNVSLSSLSYSNGGQSNFENFLTLSFLYHNHTDENIYNIIDTIKRKISVLNDTDEAVRAEKVLALYNYMEDTVRMDYLGGLSPERLKDQLQDELDGICTFLLQYSNWMNNPDLVNDEDTIDAMEDLGLPVPGSTDYGTYVQRKALTRISGNPTMFRRVFKDFINTKLDYIATVYNASVNDYESVPEEYWSNFSADEEEPGVIEKALSKLVINVSSSINKLLNSQTIRFENIIYGRVKTSGGIGLSINNFSFELEKNNVYAITGSGVFVILRGLTIVGIMVFLMYYLSKEAMVTSARERSRIKSNIGFVLLSLLLMYAMPNIVDAMIHIRDSILYEISNALGDSAFDSMYSLAENFKMLASESLELVDSFEYLGMVIITIYLAFVYIGMACSMTIMFALFPLFVIFSFRDHKILNEWFTFVLGVITTPIIDAVLFILPLLAARTSTVTDLIKLILCLSIIPARGMVRRMLGFTTSAGAELVGLGAIMAGGRAIGAMARTARNTVGTVAMGASSVASDLSNAKLHRNLARAGAGGPDLSSLGSEATDGSSPLSGTIGALGGGPTGGGGGFGGGSSGLTSAQRQVINRSANINNFEQGGILNNLDSDTASTLYNKRAARTVAQTLFKTVGTVGGGLAGGSLGLGASTFLGTNAAMMLGSGGMAMGAEVGGAAGQVTGTAVAAGLRGASSGAYAAYTKSESGVAPSVMTAAMMGSYGDLGGSPADIEIVTDKEGIPILDVNGDYVYKGQEELGTPLFSDISKGLGSNKTAVLSNLLNNDKAYAETVRNNIQRILNKSKNVNDMESKLINEFQTYGYVGASLLSDNPMESLDRAYIPNNPNCNNETFRAISESLHGCAQARIDESGKVWLPGASGAPENFDELPLAFKNINHGYYMPSFEDKKYGNVYTPMQGYIGRGMIANMKAGMSKPASEGGSSEPNVPLGEGVKKQGEAGAEGFNAYNPSAKTAEQINEDMSRINSFLNT